MKSIPCWSWAAHGKHPSVKDFFKIGQRFPLAAGFAEWVSKGYPSLSGQERSGRGGCSWRFWARGKTRNDLVCGLLRDSSDSSGRPYPLLMIGSGLLPAWEDHWEQLPWVCDGIWRQMEYISAQRFDSLERLEVEMLHCKPPCPIWSDIRSTDLGTDSPDALSRFSVPLAELLKNDVVKLSLNDIGRITGTSKHDDIQELLARMNTVMKNNVRKTPGALFMGGTFDRSFMTFFYRAINSADFSLLWAPNSNES